MVGRDVTLVTRERVGTDPLGAPVWAESETVVHDCLVAPGATDSLDESRPEGATVAYTVHWPKTFSGSLKGLSVLIDGERFDVLGDPRPYMAANCPTRWWIKSEVGHVRG